MRRIGSVLFSALVFTAACTGGGGGEESATTSPPATEAATTQTTAQTTAEPSPTEAETTQTTAEVATTEAETTTSLESTTTTAENTELAELCDAYLTFLAPATLEAGLDQLVTILGADAPPGVQAGLDTLATGGGDDIQAYFDAVSNVEGYVRPICADRFAANVIPSPDAETAANQFLVALQVGEEPVARTIATEDVVVQFDWNGYPNANMQFSAQNDTFTMLLEPTVSVFCEVNDNVVSRCVFGE